MSVTQSGHDGRSLENPLTHPRDVHSAISTQTDPSFTEDPNLHLDRDLGRPTRMIGFELSFDRPDRPGGKPATVRISMSDGTTQTFPLLDSRDIGVAAARRGKEPGGFPVESKTYDDDTTIVSGRDNTVRVYPSPKGIASELLETRVQTDFGGRQIARWGPAIACATNGSIDGSGTTGTCGVDTKIFQGSIGPPGSTTKNAPTSSQPANGGRATRHIMVVRAPQYLINQTREHRALLGSKYGAWLEMYRK